jgi:hypothetical protein
MEKLAWYSGSKRRHFEDTTHVRRRLAAVDWVVEPFLY